MEIEIEKDMNLCFSTVFYENLLVLGKNFCFVKVVYYAFLCCFIFVFVVRGNV